MEENPIYIRFKGRTLGPFPLQKARDLKRRGQITRLHEVSTDGMTWGRVEDFPELLSDDGQAMVFDSPNSLQLEPLAAPPVSSMATAAMAAGLSTGGDAGFASSPVSSTPPVQDTNHQWYYHHQGRNVGPVPTDGITSLLQSGQIHRDTLVWRAGMDDWRPAHESFFHHLTTPSPSIQPFRDTVNTVSRRGDLYHELQRSRPWVLFCAWAITLYSLGSTLYWIAFMIQGSNSTAHGWTSAMIGTLGMIITFTYYIVSVFMFRYAGVLKNMASLRSEPKAARAAACLVNTWRALGLAIFITLALVLVPFAADFLIKVAAVDVGAI